MNVLEKLQHSSCISWRNFSTRGSILITIRYVWAIQFGTGVMEATGEDRKREQGGPPADANGLKTCNEILPFKPANLY